jgi:predicted phosphodiesterase
MGKACNPARPVVLAIGDLHAPFMHQDAARFLAAVAGKTRPDLVVFLGDVADLHALSRFVRDPAGMSCGDEMKAARRQLRPIGELFPRALVCWGNHDRRIYDRAAEAGIPEDAIRGLGDILKTPAGWQWADEWEVGGVLYEHGTNWSGKDAHKKAATAAMSPVVIGHIHAHAGVSYIANRRHLFWGFYVGCLIDHKAYAFAYAKRTPDKPIIGVGIVDAGIPRFVPMPLNRGGRWTGKL